MNTLFSQDDKQTQFMMGLKNNTTQGQGQCQSKLNSQMLQASSKPLPLTREIINPANQSEGQILTKPDQAHSDQQDALFQQFVKGIPSQCIREINNKDLAQQFNLKHWNSYNSQGSQHAKQNPDHVQQINHSAQNIDIQQISGLSSISNIDQEGSRLQQIKNHSSEQIDLGQQIKQIISIKQSKQIISIKQSKQNQKIISNKKIKPIKLNMEKENSEEENFRNNNMQQYQSSPSSDKSYNHNEKEQEIPFNAGYGSFLKEMQYWAKDVSFQDQAYDIWNQQQNVTVRQDIKQTKQARALSVLGGHGEQHKKKMSQTLTVKQKYVIDFNQGQNSDTCKQNLQSNQKQMLQNHLQLKQNIKQNESNQYRFIKLIGNIQTLSTQAIELFQTNATTATTFQKTEPNQQGKQIFWQDLYGGEGCQQQYVDRLKQALSLLSLIKNPKINLQNTNFNQ